MQPAPKRTSGWPLRTKGRFEEATRSLEQAAKLSGGRDPGVLDLLGRAYAELGRFPEAVETERQALAIATQQKNFQLVEALKGRIALYESRRKR